MHELINAILAAGKSAVDLALYILLPVMVVMMAFMKLLEARGVMRFVARGLAPVLGPFGIPGAGVFAMLQLSLVSFAAPVATLRVMETDGTGRRGIAATLAMILAMSQANVVFPLVTVGLDLRWILGSSLVGGLVAAAVTWYLLVRHCDQGDTGSAAAGDQEQKGKGSALGVMIAGGQEAVQIVVQSVPILILAILLVKVLQTAGVIDLLVQLLTPLFGAIGLPGIVVLPIATKFLAGGTAMMGVVLDLLKTGGLSVNDLNRIAGFLINPCDIVGTAVLASAGAKSTSVVKAALIGALCGIVTRGLIHLLLY